MRTPAFLRRLALLLRRDRATRELEDEMRLHRELRAQSLQAGGIDASAAALAARRRFGNPLTIQEASRDMWGLGSFDSLRQDIRYAGRRLRQRPAFTLSIVAVLGLGIGATTAMFSAVDAAMLRPLPFYRPQELVTLRDINIPFDPGPGTAMATDPALALSDVAAMHDVFSGVAAYDAGGLNLSETDHPLRLNVGVASVDFFRTLAAPPLLGRTFSPEEGIPNGPRVAVLSYRLWQRHFGGRYMLNRNIQLNDKSYLVVGVMGPGFSFPKESDLWIPMSLPNTFATFEPFRGFLQPQVVARLAPGMDRRTASLRLLMGWQRKLTSPASSGVGARADDRLADLRTHGTLAPLQQQLVGDRRTGLLVLLGATGLLLLIACANITNLLLSQAAARRRELALRAVLGATRARVVRQLLTESILLALTGAAAGLALAPLLLGVTRSLLPVSLAGVAPAAIDFRVLAFATAIGLITGIGFGLWPALGHTRTALASAVKAGGGHGATRGSRRGHRMLVAAELALTVMLLIGAGLMLRSFSRMMGMERGIVTEHVATGEMAFPGIGDGRAARLAKMNAMVARLQSTPGINDAGFVNELPLGAGGGISLGVAADGMPQAGGKMERSPVRYLIADGGYFRTMGIALLRGRVFTSADDSSASHVAVISRKMAALYWPGVDPLGRVFRTPGDSQPRTVIGVVADVRDAGLDREPTPQMYFAQAQQWATTITLVVRGTLAPQAMLTHLNAAVHAADPRQAVFHQRMMDDVISASIAPRRTNTLLIGLFAGMALVLAVFGTYAVVANNVAQRMREFGIRAALGARGRDLLTLVSREMFGVVTIGAALGLAGGWAFSRVMESLLYGVQVHDFATFLVVPATLIVTTAIATLIPARRALRVNPADVIRAD